MAYMSKRLKLHIGIINPRFFNHYKKISLTIQHGICKFLLLKFFLQKNDLSPEIMKDVFELKELFYSVSSKRNYFVMKCEVEELVDFNLLIF